jgi:hypothetical protein
VCKVCGEGYVPAETASSEKDTWVPQKSLREVMGAERFGAFARTYLMRRGMSERDAAETVACSEAREVEREREAADYRRRQEQRQQYIDEVLFAGLRSELRPAEVEGEEPTVVFEAGEFEKLLERCAAQRLQVWLMAHHATSPAGCRPKDHKELAAIRRNPLKVFRRWLAEGCNERFSARVGVPESVLDAFAARRREGAGPGEGGRGAGSGAPG